MSREVQVSKASLLAWLDALFSGAGLSRVDASLIASTLVDAESRGVRSHGLLLVPMYLDRIAKGVIRRDYRVTVVTRTGSCAVVDGDAGPGQCVLMCALGEAQEICSELGAAFVVVRNSNHVGMLSSYALRAVENGLVCLVATNTGPSVGAFGGRGQRMGNNAICIAAPSTSTAAFCLDMSTATVATGKVRVAAAEGLPVPDGWIVDRSGNPSNDPATLDGGGWATPLGGYKGYGLAVAVDILTALLAGGPPSPRIDNKKIEPGRGMDFSQTIIVADPLAFGRNAFASELGNYLNVLRATPSLDDAEPVVVPGQREAERSKRSDTISLLVTLVQGAYEAAVRSGVVIGRLS